MGFLPGIPVLHGSLVRLEPLSLSHAADLAVAAGENRSAYGFTVAGWPATKAALCDRLAHSRPGGRGR